MLVVNKRTALQHMAALLLLMWLPGMSVAQELEEVTDSFKRDWLTMGPKVQAFENKMAELLEVPYAVAVSNGSIALDMALKILGVGPGDEVIVPALTYFATAAAVSYQHAIPVFVDIEPQSYNLLVIAKLHNNSKIHYDIHLNSNTTPVICK